MCARSENIYASNIETIYASSENIYASLIENMYGRGSGFFIHITFYYLWVWNLRYVEDVYIILFNDLECAVLPMALYTTKQNQ